MNTYYCEVEYTIGGGKTSHFDYPEIKSNSFTMAVAHFERMALTDARCGIIVKMEVHRSLPPNVKSN
jgi:hypothetical protein